MTKPVVILLLGASLSCGGRGDGVVFPKQPFMTAISASGNLHVAVRSAPTQPPQRGLISLEYAVTDQQGHPVDGLAFTVLPWMPTMHHAASPIAPIVTPAGGGSGLYYITNTAFTMPGEVQLLTSITAPAMDSVAPDFVVD